MSNISEIDIRKLTDAVQNGYLNEAITEVNDHVIRVSVMTTGYPWHQHPNSDETFIVMEGTLVLETQDKVLNLAAGQMATVPANVVHRTRPAGTRSVNLTVERQNTETVFL
ncbi:MAG: cupin domain-containing protein [Verrucomicrobia bacterium]|nr:cupin domain-containing protein [Verrucomicrobiota bacterium]MBV8280244.1 cupin domain-containing protein [Verrucomicrobiota bacterium]